MAPLRVLRRIALGLVLLLLVPAVLVVLINLPDEPLDGAAQKRLVVAPEHAEGNGAAGLWALDAPAGVDAVVVGRTLFEAYQTLARDDPTRLSWPIKRPYREAPFQFPRELACADAKSACIATYVEHAATVHALARTHAELLGRLAAIDSAVFWHELAPPAAPQGPQQRLADLTGIFSLSLGIAAIDVAEGRSAAGIERLEQDVRIARRVLAGSDSLLTKMVASDMLRRALLAYSEVLDLERSSAPSVAALASSLERVAMDLSPAERSLGAPLDYEARVLRTLVLQLARGDASSAGSFQERLALWATPLLFKPDATSNLQAQLFDLEAPLMEADAADFALQVEPVRRQLAAHAARFAALDWRALYNPLGKTFASDPPDLTGAAARVHDDEVLMRAVRLKARMLHEAVAFGEAAQYAASARPPLVDPYSGRSFRWRAAEAALELPELGPHPVVRLPVPLGSPR